MFRDCIVGELKDPGLNTKTTTTTTITITTTKTVYFLYIFMKNFCIILTIRL